MTIGVLDKDGAPQTISTVDDLIAILGAVTANPVANTLLDRLKQIQANTDGLEGFVDGIEGLITGTNAALVTLQGLVDQLEGYNDGVETSLSALVAGLGSPGPLVFGSSTSIVPATTSDATKHRITSAASENNTLVNAAARMVRSIDVYNEAAYAVYLKLYDKATAPSSADTPFFTIPIPAGSGYARTFIWGMPVSLGLGYRITKVKADADATPVAANDLVGLMTWR